MSDVGMRHAVFFNNLIIQHRHSIDIPPSTASLVKEIRYCVIAIVLGVATVFTISKCAGRPPGAQRIADEQRHSFSTAPGVFIVTESESLPFLVCLSLGYGSLQLSELQPRGQSRRHAPSRQNFAASAIACIMGISQRSSEAHRADQLWPRQEV
jgi:hypothetical protein